MSERKTKEYLFSPSESAGDIAQFVFDNWPPEWEEESVSWQNESRQIIGFITALVSDLCDIDKSDGLGRVGSENLWPLVYTDY